MHTMQEMGESTPMTTELAGQDAGDQDTTDKLI